MAFDEDSDGSFEMLAIQEEQPVETFIPDGPHQRAATAFACGARNGERTISIPSVRNTSSKLAVTF